MPPVTLRGAAAAALLVCALQAASPAAAGLLVNPSFETGDFSGWTQVGVAPPVAFPDQLVTTDPRAPDGTHVAVFQKTGAASGITQDFAAAPGAQLDVSFWLFGPFTSVGSSFVVTFNGMTLLALTAPGNLPPTFYSFTGLAGSASGANTLSFSGRSDNSLWMLDAVLVDDGTRVPEPMSATLLAMGLFGLTLARRAGGS